MKTYSPSSFSSGRLPILLGLVVIALQAVKTISHADFWIHLAAGRWVAQSGISRLDPLTGGELVWRNTSWLYDWLLYVTWSMGGAGLVVLVHAALLVLAFAFLARAVSGSVPPLAIGFALILSGWLLAPALTVSPALVGLLFMAIFIYMLMTRPFSKALFAWLLPLQVIWANLHAGFLWGPAIILIFSIQSYLQHAEDHRQGEAVQGMLLALAAVLVAVVNPYGVALFPAALANWSAPTTSDWISPLAGQFQSTPTRHIVTLALAIGAAGLLTFKQRLPIASTSLAVISAFLAVQTKPFYIGLFALMSFPFLCLSLQSASVYARGKWLAGTTDVTPRVDRFLMPLIMIVALTSAFFVVTNRYYVHIGSLSHFGLGVAQGVFPTGTAALLDHEEMPKSLLHLPIDGGYLAWQHPDRTIVIDQRAALHGNERYALLARGLVGDPEAWQEIERHLQPEALLLNHLWPFAADAIRNLEAQDWELIYFDGVASLLLRNRPHTQTLLQNQSVTQTAGLQRLEATRRDYVRQLGSLIRPPVSAPLYGAGNLFRDRRMFEQAVACFEPLTLGAPRLVTARLSLGIGRLRLQQFEAAIEDLEQAQNHLKSGTAPWLLAQLNLGMARVEVEQFAHAIRALQQVVQVDPQNTMAWLWLSRAYTGNQQLNEAQQATQRARELDGELTARFLRP